MRTALAIFGGGPAGSSIALLAAKAGIDTVLIFTRSGQRGYESPEILPPEAKPALENLGVWNRFLGSGFPRQRSMASAWGAADVSERHSISNALGAGWRVDRERFDALLREAAGRAGVTQLHRGRLSSLSARNTGWRLTFADGSAVTAGKR